MTVETQPQNYGAKSNPHMYRCCREIQTRSTTTSYLILPLFLSNIFHQVTCVQQSTDHKGIRAQSRNLSKEDMEGKLKNSKDSFPEFKNYQRRADPIHRQRRTFLANNVSPASERGNSLRCLINTLLAISAVLLF